MDYVVVHAGSVEDLQKGVNEKLALGYELTGGPICGVVAFTRDSAMNVPKEQMAEALYQAMLKR